MTGTELQVIGMLIFLAFIALFLLGIIIFMVISGENPLRYDVQNISLVSYEDETQL